MVWKSCKSVIDRVSNFNDLLLFMYEITLNWICSKEIDILFYLWIRSRKIATVFFHQLQQMLRVKYFRIWWKFWVFSLLLIVRTKSKEKMYSKVANCFYLRSQILRIKTGKTWNHYLVNLQKRNCSKTKKVKLKLTKFKSAKQPVKTKKQKKSLSKKKLETKIDLSIL